MGSTRMVGFTMVHDGGSLGTYRLGPCSTQMIWPEVVGCHGSGVANNCCCLGPDMGGATWVVNEAACSGFIATYRNP